MRRARQLSGLSMGLLYVGDWGIPHEGGRLGQRELRGVLREVTLCGRLDAIRARAVVDGVEVHEQDVVLAVALLHLDGKIRLAHLAFQGDAVHFRDEDGVAHELLRDGGRALQVAAHQVVHEGAGDAHQVHAAMLVEALVLGGHGALQGVGTDLVDGHRLAVLELELGEHGLLVRCVHDGGKRGVERIGVLVVGQVLQPRGPQRVDADESGHQNGRYDGYDGQHADGRVLLLDAGTILDRTRSHRPPPKSSPIVSSRHNPL